MLQTLCLPFFSNILNPNTVFALLRFNINDLIFTTQGFWELSAPNVVNILLCCAQISVGLVRNASAGLLVMSVRFDCGACARFSIFGRRKNVRPKPSEHA
jgi:hypothetical protein